MDFYELMYVLVCLNLSLFDAQFKMFESRSESNLQLASVKSYLNALIHSYAVATF